MSLGKKQEQFARMLTQLLVWAHLNGYAIRIDEAYRPPETAELYARQGRGIANSLHTIKLAIDLNFFKDGTYLTTVKDYEPAGLFWESIGGYWGGRFGDGRHFSLEHNGVK